MTLVAAAGSDSEVTGSAQKMLEACEEEMRKVERELEQLEAEINPALDDNALVAFSYLLSKIVDEMRAVPEVNPHVNCINFMQTVFLVITSLGHSIIRCQLGRFLITTKLSRNQWIYRQCER